MKVGDKFLIFYPKFTNIFSVLQAVNTRRHQKTGVSGGSKIKFSADFAVLLPRFAPFLTIIQALIILNNAPQGAKKGVVQAGCLLWYIMKNVPQCQYPAPSFAPEREHGGGCCNQRKSLKYIEITTLEGAN